MIETGVGVAAAGMSVAVSLPQIIKTFKRKQVDDLSLLMWWVMFTAQVLWVAYGALRGDMIIIATNVFTASGGAAMLLMIYAYRKR